MPDTRASWWTRWPDEDSGPLWVGLHCNERAGRTRFVGIELWTEAPGAARRSLGPEADPSEDLLPWPPTGIRTVDLRALHLGPLLDRFREALRGADDPVMAQAAESLAVTSGGRPRAYEPAHYGQVAGVYLKAVREGRGDPTKAVAERWSVSTSAASKWVAHARTDGLLDVLRQN